MHWKLPLFDGEESGIARDPAGLDAVQSFGGVRRIFRGGSAIAKQCGNMCRSPSSPKAIDTVKTFTAFLLSVVAGAQCFAHASLLRRRRLGRTEHVWSSRLNGGSCLPSEGSAS